MKQYLNVSVFYILLWSLYYLQGTLYAEGSIISQLLLLLLLLYSSYCFVKVVVSYKLPPLFVSINIFLGIMTIYGIIFIILPQNIYIGDDLSTPVVKMNFLKNLYMSILPIYVMFYFSKKKILTEKVVKFIFIILLITYMFLFERNYQSELLDLLEKNSNEESVVNNMAYHFLKLFPLLFFWNKKPLVQFLFTAVIFSFILSGMKRGVILIGFICLLWFLYNILKNSHAKQRLVVVLLSTLFIIVGILYVSNLYESDLFFKYRIEQTLEGDSSNRDIIYSTLWEHFQQESSLLKMLFGNGVFYTVFISGTFAHNDWLELLTNQGLLGVFAYLLFYITFAYTIYLNRRNLFFVSVMGMSLIIMFISSFISMSYDAIGLAPALGIGYSMCQISNKRI